MMDQILQAVKSITGQAVRQVRMDIANKLKATQIGSLYIKLQ